MKELLKQWAELEPDRCKWVPNEYNEKKWDCWFILGQYIHSSFESKELDFVEEGWLGVIQYAVQHVIEAHGWQWELHGSRAYQSAVVKHSGITMKIKDADTCAEALLSAYIKALQAQETE